MLCYVMSAERVVADSNPGRTNTQSRKNNWGECAALVVTSRGRTVLDSWKSLEKFLKIAQTWKKSGKMVKWRVLYKWNLFRFGQILLNLACAFSVHHEKSFVPESFKVSIDHVIDYLESGKRQYCSVKKSVRDWSKSIGGRGPEHLEIWLIKNTWPTPSLRHKNDWTTPKARLEIAWPTP